jgi:hypothetical protein
MSSSIAIAASIFSRGCVPVLNEFLNIGQKRLGLVTGSGSDPVHARNCARLFVWFRSATAQS